MDITLEMEFKATYAKEEKGLGLRAIFNTLALKNLQKVAGKGRIE